MCHLPSDQEVQYPFLLGLPAGQLAHAHPVIRTTRWSTLRQGSIRTATSHMLWGLVQTATLHYVFAFSKRFCPKRLPRETFTKLHRSLIITTIQTLRAAKTWSIHCENQISAKGKNHKSMQLNNLQLNNMKLKVQECTCKKAINSKIFHSEYKVLNPL